MNKKNSVLINYLTICIKWRKFIFTCIFFVGVTAAILSLIVPEWYRSSAKIVPPSEEEKSMGISALISKIPIPSSLLGLAGVSEGTSLSMAILQSRTVMEAVVRKFHLIPRYKDKNIEKAVKTLRKRCSFEIDEEGTIGISVIDRTKYFHSKKQCEETKIFVHDMTNYFIQQLDSLNKTLRTEKARNLRIFLSKRCRDSFADLEEEEEQLRIFQEKYGAISLPEQTLVAIESAAQIKAEIISKEIEIGFLKQIVGLDHSQLSKAMAELMQLQKQYNKFSYGDDKDNLFIPFQKIPQYGLEYARHLRKIKIQEILIEFLVPQYEQAKIQELKDTPTIQVIDDASIPIRKIKPKRFLIVIFSIMFSFLISSIFVSFLEKMKELEFKKHDTYKSIQWIKNQILNDLKFLRKK